MPQTQYDLDLNVALPGMLVDSGIYATEITSRAASEVIPPGRVCVLDSAGTVSLPKTASAAIPANGTGSIVGVSVYLSASPPGGYQIGDMVPLLRKGRIWGEFTGTGATENEAMNISHSSTTATHRGKFTDTATSTTTGSEITAFSRGVARGGGTNLALVDINLP